MPIFKEKIQIIYAFLALALCSAFSYLAIHCYYADSEIWLLTTSQKVFSPQEFIAIYYKWFFHLVTYVATLWTNESLLIYTSARITYALIALLSVLLIASIFSHIYENKKLFLPLTIMTLSSTLFFNQAFRIRADILALFLHLLFLYIVCLSKNKKLQKIYILIPIQALLVLTTPKTIIFIFLHLALGIFLWRQTTPAKDLGKKILASLFIPLCFGFFILSLIAIFLPQHSLLMSIHSAVNFYLKSTDPRLGGAQFFSFFDFMYLLRFFKNSPVHSLSFLFWLVLFFWEIFSKNNKSTLVYFFKIYTALLIIFVTLYNQKLPFFLAAFLAPAIACQFCVFYRFFSQRKKLKMLIPILLIAASVISLKQLTVNLKFNNNSAQKIFISELQNFKNQNPRTTIYDVIGLLPKNTTHHIFVGPGDISHREQIVTLIKANLPDVYLFTFKNIFLGDEIYKVLNEFYFEYSPGVWLRSIKINLNTDTKLIQNILQINKKNYWVSDIDKKRTILDTKTKKDITNECLFLDSLNNVSQNEIQRIAVPLSNPEISIVKAPLTHFSLNPQHLFMFDTAF